MSFSFELNPCLGAQGVAADPEPAIKNSDCRVVLENISAMHANLYVQDDHYASLSSPAVEFWLAQQFDRLDAKNPWDPEIRFDRRAAALDFVDSLLLKIKRNLSLSYIQMWHAGISLRLKSFRYYREKIKTIRRLQKGLLSEEASVSERMRAIEVFVSLIERQEGLQEVALQVLFGSVPLFGWMYDFNTAYSFEDIRYERLLSDSKWREPFSPYFLEWYIFGDGTFAEMNGFFPFPIGPAGVALQSTYADGREMPPAEFLRHDRVHNLYGADEKFKYPNRNSNADLYQELLSVENRLEFEMKRRDRIRQDTQLTGSQKEALEAFWFFLWHEDDVFLKGVGDPYLVGGDLGSQFRSRKFSSRSVDGDMGVRSKEDIDFAIQWVFQFLREVNSPDKSPQPVHRPQD